MSPIRRLRTIILLLLILALPVACRTPAVAPTTHAGTPWRIAYYEGGPWPDYQSNLWFMVVKLIQLGWIEQLTLPTLPDDQDTAYLWQWLAENADSDYIRFLPDAYWSADWDEAQRAINRQACLERLQGGDVDVILAVGTWAGLDLVNDQHDVPTLVLSTSNAVNAGIIDDPRDSGHDHVHVKTDPEKYLREIRIFYETIRFEQVGVIYDMSVPDGRIYSAIPELETVAAERGFEIVACDATEINVDMETAQQMAYRCIQELAPQIDAFYITSHRGLTAEALPDVLTPLFEHNVPTWAMEGDDLVKRGALLSIARPNASGEGFFAAETLARILNGATPRDVDQVLEEPRRLAINVETARRIGFVVPSALLNSADMVFDEIDGE